MSAIISHQIPQPQSRIHTCSHLQGGVSLNSHLGMIIMHVKARDSSSERLTKIFALGITTFPTHVLVHGGPYAVEVCIAALDGQGGGDGQDRSGQ
jgi:hypothetical protein